MRDVAGKLEFCLDDLIEESFLVNSLEGESAHSQSIQDHAQRPDICRLAIVALTLDDFRSDVVRSSAEVVQNVILFRQLPTEPKVNHLRF